MFNYEVALNYWEVFLLILVRIASFVYTAPFFNTTNTPQRVKLGLAVFISVIIFTLLPDKTVEYDSVTGYAVLVVKESVVGLLLGFAAMIAVYTINFAGHIIDVDIGLSMAQAFDPTSNMQTGLSAKLYYYTAFLILLSSGLHQFLITAIVDTYEIIPIGAVTVNISLYSSVVGLVADYFIIGFRIALPVFAAMLLMSAILGVFAKVAPQLNMFAVGIQLKLLVGLTVLFITVSMLPYISSFVFDFMKSAVRAIAKGLT